jgi:hypothetical protein
MIRFLTIKGDGSDIPSTDDVIRVITEAGIDLDGTAIEMSPTVVRYNVRPIGGHEG